MNKKVCLIIVISFLAGVLLSGSVFLIFNHNNDNKVSNNNVNNNEVNNNNEEEDNNKEDNNIDINDGEDYEKLANGYYEIAKNDYTYIKEDGNNLVDAMTNQVIYDANKKYAKTKLDNLNFLNDLTVDNPDLHEYLKYFFWFFREESKTSFSKEDMSIILSFAADMTYTPRDSEYIKNLAKRYFNVDNFEMIPGTYTALFSKYQLEKYTIMKKNGYYVMGGLEPGEIDLKYTAYMTDVKVNGNKVTVYYDYATNGVVGTGCYIDDLTQEIKEECRIGTYRLEITMDKDKQIFAVDKMIYTKAK